MTAVTFFTASGKLTGFMLSGHATACESDIEGKLVCSAVSSAAYMTANTLTEIIGAHADITVDEGSMELHLSDKIGESQELLKGFRLHITELTKQYQSRIIVSEV